jgi:hypothetical protein
MRSVADERIDTATWDVACPERASRVAGISMAGFGVRSGEALRMVPHPAVTLILDFGAGPAIVDDAAGRRQRGSLVAGLGFGFGGAVRWRGENVECVQVRLSPVIARAVLGASPAELNGAVALDDLWGREAARVVTPATVAGEPWLAVDDTAWPATGHRERSARSGVPGNNAGA